MTNEKNWLLFKSGILLWILPDKVHHFQTVNEDVLKQFDSKKLLNEGRLCVEDAMFLQNSELKLYDPSENERVLTSSENSVFITLFILSYFLN